MGRGARFNVSGLGLLCDEPESSRLVAANIQQCVSASEQWMAASRLRLNTDKTEPMSTGTKHNLSNIPGCGLDLTLGRAHVAKSDDVRVLGVLLLSDLSLDKHRNVVSAKCLNGIDLLIVVCADVFCIPDIYVIIVVIFYFFLEPALMGLCPSGFQPPMANKNIVVVVVVVVFLSTPTTTSHLTFS